MPLPAILVVDDSDAALKATVRILKQAGYEVAQAVNGRDAVARIRELRPALVLLDVVLPDIDGREVLRQVRADSSLEGVSVVFFSSEQILPEQQAAGLDAGADGYIARPIAAPELVARVRLHLRQRELTEQLRASEARLVAAQRVAKVGSWEVDLASMGVIWTEESHRIFEVGRAEGYRSWRENFLSVVHPEDRRKVKSAFLSSLRHQSPCVIEHRVLLPDGRIKFIEQRWQAFHDEAGRPARAVGICQDISERRQAEEEVSRANETLAGIVTTLQEVAAADLSLQEVMNVMAARAQALTGGAGGIVELVEGEEMVYHAVSGAVSTSLGLRLRRRGSLSGLAVDRDVALVCDDAETDDRVDRAACRKLGLRSMVVVPLRDRREVIGVLKVMSDQPRAFAPRDVGNLQILVESFGAIIQRQRSAEQLRASEAQYRLLFAGSPHPMWVYDPQTLRFLMVNEAACQQYGFSEEEFHALTIRDLRPADEIAAIEAVVASPMDAKRRSGGWRHRRKDGTIIDVEISAETIELNGQPARLVLAQDVTERLGSERELARTNRALRLLSRGNEALIRAHSESGLLHELCEIAVEVGGARMAWVGYAGYDAAKPIVPQAQAGVDDGFLASVGFSWAEEQPSGQGPVGETIRKGLPVVVSDLADWGGNLPMIEAAQARGHRAMVCLPLRDQSISFGLLALYFGEVREVPADELRLLQDLADNLAFGILNQRTRLESRRTQEALLITARGVSAATGEAFFEKLTRSMMEALGAQAGSIARLGPPDFRTAQTICAVVDGKTVPHFGYELAGTPCEELVPGEVRVVPRELRRLYPALRTRCETAGEAFVGMKLFNAAGAPIGVMAVQYQRPLEQPEFVASTLKIFAARATAELERDQAEARTREQAALIDEARDGILVCDLGHAIRFWSKGAERLYGWTAAEAIGRGLDDLLQVDPAGFAEANRTVREDGEWTGEVRKTARNGAVIIVNGRWTLLRDAERQPKSILMIDTDVTERKKMEQQFLRTQRMESIGTLSGGIAHDLNNLLAPIVMGVGLLRQYDPSEASREIIQIIERSARRGTDLVKQVLSFARGVEGDRVAVHLRHIVREVEAMCESTFPKNIEVETNVPNELGLVLGDPTQLNQVLLNLCVNARDAMPNGGNLMMAAVNTTVDAQYAVMNHGATAGRYVLLEVTDTGDGIPPEVVDRIFEPFFTTKELGKGTGLGLSTVLAIVRSHGGFLNVSSTPGKGSSFKVYLPLPDKAEEPEVSTPEEEGLPRGHGELILVVDDEAPILQITRQTLEAFGYRVVVAEDGAQAIGVYALHRAEVALVLTDMMMPVMDGPALIGALQRVNPGVRIIAVSGVQAAGGAPRAMLEGVKYLAKPYTAEAMLRLVRSVLSEGGTRPPS